MNLNEYLRIEMLNYGEYKYNYYEIPHNTFDIVNDTLTYNDNYDSIQYYLEGLKLRINYLKYENKEQLTELTDLLIELYDNIQINNCLLEYIDKMGEDFITRNRKDNRNDEDLDFSNSFTTNQLKNYIYYNEIYPRNLSEEIKSDCNTFNENYLCLIKELRNVTYES